MMIPIALPSYQVLNKPINPQILVYLAAHKDEIGKIEFTEIFEELILKQNLKKLQKFSLLSMDMDKRKNKVSGEQEAERDFVIGLEEGSGWLEGDKYNNYGRENLKGSISEGQLVVLQQQGKESNTLIGKNPYEKTLDDYMDYKEELERWETIYAGVKNWIYSSYCYLRDTDTTLYQWFTILQKRGKLNIEKSLNGRITRQDPSTELYFKAIQGFLDETLSSLLESIKSTKIAKRKQKIGEIRHIVRELKKKIEKNYTYFQYLKRRCEQDEVFSDFLKQFIGSEYYNNEFLHTYQKNEKFELDMEKRLTLLNRKRKGKKGRG